MCCKSRTTWVSRASRACDETCVDRGVVIHVTYYQSCVAWAIFDGYGQQGRKRHQAVHVSLRVACDQSNTLSNVPDVPET